MRFSRGSRLLVGSLLPLLALAGPSLSPVRAALSPEAASVGVTTIGALTRVGVADPRALARQAALAPLHLVGQRRLPALYPYATAQQHAAQARAAEVSTFAPAAQSVGAAEALAVTSTNIVTSFQGLTAVDTTNINSYTVEPPDQGLCQGAGAVLEQVNLVVQLYDNSGVAQLNSPVSANAFFAESGGLFPTENVSDPRCYYDAQAKAWFSTVLAYSFTSAGAVAESHVDIAVNPTTDPTSPWTIYRLDTSHASVANCPCLADQPLLGVDAHGVFITTNEFSADLTTFNGAQAYAISKAQLLALSASPHVVGYTSLTNGGVMAASLQPAVTPGAAPAEYFMDSLDPNGTVDNRVGVWALTNEAVLDTGGIPTLSGVVIRSEGYGLPPQVIQRGSTATLNPDDDRMQQVQNVGGTLWASLDTVIKPSGDTTNRAGAAWFKVTPALGSGTIPVITGAALASQGYVALSGNYLTYPAIAVNGQGNAAMALSLSGPRLYPSVAYATGPNFSILKGVAIGPAPSSGFTCVAPYGPPCRWGDYAAAVWSGDTGPRGARLPQLWLATEYTAAPTAGIQANWATRVFAVNPAGS